MFAPVIHTYGAISSVRNALRVYLWLQNPPDRGGLIFMGSVNRDFVFAGRRAGRARRAVHTWNSHTGPGDGRRRGGGQGREGSRLRYCTVDDDAQQQVPCTHARTRMSTRQARHGLGAIWEAALWQKWKNSPCLYSLGLSYRLRSEPPSPLLSSLLLCSSRQLLY